MNKRHFYYLLPLILLSIVAVAGWFAKDYLGNEARQEIIKESRSSVLTLSIHVSSTITHIEGAVKSLAGSPWIAPALMSKSNLDIGQANSALDRYNSTLDASVSYLMDADGLTVASSNRKDQDSFVGKSYLFRSYFQAAARGRAGHYFALGITSGKRGFYASYPVQNSQGKVLGVVAMKKDLDKMETFFSNYPFCFFVSPDGIIFLSSSPEMVLKSLWPLDKAAQEKLIASKQFGNKPFEAVINKEIADGSEVHLKGKDYFVSRLLIGSDGWSIVLLTPTQRVWIFKLIGILATIIVCIIILVFLIIFYLTGRSQEAIRQSEESKGLLLQAAGEGIFGVNATGELTFVNPAATRQVGFAEEEMLGQSAHTLIHHSHQDGSNYPVEECPMYASYTKATEKRVAEEVLWRKDGSSFPVEYFSTPIIRDSRVMGAVVVFKNITERKQAEEALRQSEERYRNIIEQMEDGYFETDLSGNFTFVNNAECRNLGYAREELIGMNNRQYVEEKNLKELDNLFVQLYKTRIPIKAYALELLKKDGAKAYNEISVTLIADAEGKPVGFRGISRDITERKHTEEKIRQMAYHDSLTGLPNRKLFSDRLAVALVQARRNEKKVGIAMLDLDNFKGVNDTFGHEVGDLFLKATAERLRAALRKGDTIARFGGDEFVLIFPDLKGIEDAIRVAQKIVDFFGKPFLIDTHQVVVTMSIGIAAYPDDGTDEVMLLKNADIAMYQAKQAGRNRYKLYNEA